MSRTAAGARLTQAHRQTQLRVRAAALRDVTRLWRGVDPTDLSGTIERFAQAAAVVTLARNRQSAEAAARYFERFRAAEQAPGDAGVDLAEPPREDRAGSVLRGAGLAGIVIARGKGFSPSAAAGRGLLRVSGSTSNLVLAGARDTIMASTAADPGSTGRWQRVTSGNPCAFCTMIASRGAVFTAETGGFEAHDNCACQPEPAYEGTQLPATSERLRDEIEAAGVDPEDVTAIREALDL